MGDQNLFTELKNLSPFPRTNASKLGPTRKIGQISIENLRQIEKIDFFQNTKMEITNPKIMFRGQKSHQTCQIIISRNCTTRFLIFRFFPKWRPFKSAKMSLFCNFRLFGRHKWLPFWKKSKNQKSGSTISRYYYLAGLVRFLASICVF